MAVPRSAPSLNLRGSDGALRWDSVFANSFDFDADSIIRVLVGDGVDNDTDLNFDFLNCPGGCQFGGLGVPHFEVFGGHGDLYVDAGRLMFRLDAVGGGGGGGGGVVPVPATLSLLALGLLVSGVMRCTRMRGCPNSPRKFEARWFTAQRCAAPSCGPTA